MAGPQNSILAVEHHPSIQGLLYAVAGGDTDDIDISVVSSPEEGTELLLGRKAPFSIIWAEEKFKNSRSNGLDFLASCADHSPTSSRILRSTSLSDRELQSRVRGNELQSYLSNKCAVSVSDNMLSAISCGVEFHKIKILDQWLAVTDFSSEDLIDAELQEFENISNRFEGDWSFHIESRDAEQDSFLALTNTIIPKLQVVTAEQQILKDTLTNKGAKEKLLVLNEFAQKFAHVEAHLSRAKLILAHNQKSISMTKSLTSKLTQKINRLKKEFMDE
jgi:hypothetical protein